MSSRIAPPFWRLFHDRILTPSWCAARRLACLHRYTGGLPSHEFTFETFQSLSMTIAAGSSQIQRNIVGERILGQIKEPKPNPA